MNGQDSYWVITFPSVYHALRGEKVLQAAGLPAELIPVPRQLSGSCEGLAAKLPAADVAAAVEALRKAGAQMVKEGIEIKGKLF